MAIRSAFAAVGYLCTKLRKDMFCVSYSVMLAQCCYCRVIAQARSLAQMQLDSLRHTAEEGRKESDWKNASQ